MASHCATALPISLLADYTAPMHWYSPEISWACVSSKNPLHHFHLRVLPYIFVPIYGVDLFSAFSPPFTVLLANKTPFLRIILRQFASCKLIHPALASNATRPISRAFTLCKFKLINSSLKHVFLSFHWQFYKWYRCEILYGHSSTSGKVRPGRSGGKHSKNKSIGCVSIERPAIVAWAWMVSWFCAWSNIWQCHSGVYIIYTLHMYSISIERFTYNVRLCCMYRRLHTKRASSRSAGGWAQKFQPSNIHGVRQNSIDSNETVMSTIYPNVIQKAPFSHNSHLVTAAKVLLFLWPSYAPNANRLIQY